LILFEITMTTTSFTYSTAGNYIVDAPPGAYAVDITYVGAGGGGSGGCSGNNTSYAEQSPNLNLTQIHGASGSYAFGGGGSGGGSGTSGKVYAKSVTLGDLFNITLGAGGTGGAGGNIIYQNGVPISGSNGQTSTITYNGASFLTINGGQGGQTSSTQVARSGGGDTFAILPANGGNGGTLSNSTDIGSYGGASGSIGIVWSGSLNAVSTNPLSYYSLPVQGTGSLGNGYDADIFPSPKDGNATITTGGSGPISQPYHLYPAFVGGGNSTSSVANNYHTITATNTSGNNWFMRGVGGDGGAGGGGTGGAGAMGTAAVSNGIALQGPAGSAGLFGCGGGGGGGSFIPQSGSTATQGSAGGNGGDAAVTLLFYLYIQ